MAEEGGAAGEQTIDGTGSVEDEEAGWLHHWFGAVLIYAAKNPWDFIFYVLLMLSPLLLISVFLSWKLSKAIDKQQQDKKRKARLQSNLAKTRHRKED